MNHKVLLGDSQIREAWKLFISKGILKRDVLRDDIAFSWTRLRLSGLDPNREEVIFEKKLPDQNSINFALSERFSLWLQESGCNLFLLTEYNQVISKFIYHHDFNLMTIDRCTLLNSKGCGELSCHLTVEGNNASKIIGHEHYLRLFHQMADMCLKFEVEGKLYKALVTTSINQYTEDLLYSFERLFNEPNLHVYKADSPTIEVKSTVDLIDSFSSTRFILKVNASGELLTPVYVDSQFIDKGQSIFKFLRSLKLSDLHNEESIVTRLSVNENSVLVLIETIRCGDMHYSLYGKSTNSLSAIATHMAGVVDTDIRSRCTEDIMIDPDAAHYYKRLSEGFRYALITYYNENDFLVLSESLSRQLRSSGKRNGCFIVVECSYYTTNELLDKLFGNEAQGIIGILEWIGSGVVVLKGFEKTDAKLQIDVYKWLTNALKLADYPSVIVGLSANEMTTMPKLVSGLEDLLKVNSYRLKSYREMPIRLKKAIKNTLVKRGLSDKEIVECLMLLDDHTLEAYNYDIEGIGEFLTCSTHNKYPITRKDVSHKEDLSDLTLKEAELLRIKKVLRENNYNYAKTALNLGISRSTLYRKLKTTKT
jgi:hypothetical protein